MPRRPEPFHLPPDSPLAKPLAFARMTMDAEIQCELLGLDSDEELRSQTSKVPRTLPPEYIQLRHTQVPCYSLMSDDEAEALLTFPGTVWFLEQATGLYAERCARICAMGQPWPVWRTRANFLLSTPAFSLDDAVYLAQLFYKKKMPLDYFHLKIQHPRIKYSRRMYEMLFTLCSLEWEKEQPIEEPSDTYWMDVAEKAGEHVHAIRCIALALEIYLHCLVKYATRRGIEHVLLEEDKTDA